MENFEQKFKDVKILVLGDVMLDQYWWGGVDRISPEAPVPIVSLKKKSLVAGGAANVAANVAGLGAKPYLVGVIGNDAESGDLKNLLESSHVSPGFLIETDSRPTCVKTRIIANNQQIVRIDRESDEDLTAEIEESAWKALRDLIGRVDVVLISDYAKGVVTSSLCRNVIVESRKLGKVVLVDPKGKDYSKYCNANILTPNQKEALDASGYEDTSDETINKAGAKLISSFELDHLVITRGEKGMTLFSREGSPRRLETHARTVYDVTGAGDTVISTIGVALAAGFTFAEACKLANIAAGIVVEGVGTTPISVVDLDKEYRAFA